MIIKYIAITIFFSLKRDTPPYNIVMDLKDRKILLEIAQGNQKAKICFWEIWNPRIKVFLSNRKDIPPEEKEDLLQSIMEKLYMKASYYNPVYSPATWIYTLAKNYIRDWKEKERNRLHLIQAQRNSNNDKNGADFFSSIPGRFPDPETSFIENEELSLIRNFILRQEPGDRQILFLICYEGLSGRQAASIMGCPASTIRDRIKKLKGQLEAEL